MRACLIKFCMQCSLSLSLSLTMSLCVYAPLLIGRCQWRLGANHNAILIYVMTHTHTQYLHSLETRHLLFVRSHTQAEWIEWVERHCHRRHRHHHHFFLTLSVYLLVFLKLFFNVLVCTFCVCTPMLSLSFLLVSNVSAQSSIPTNTTHTTHRDSKRAPFWLTNFFYHFYFIPIYHC